MVWWEVWCRARPPLAGTAHIAGAHYINLSMFFAFAMLYPDTQFLLFFFIPVKVKWLATGIPVPATPCPSARRRRTCGGSPAPPPAFSAASSAV